MIALLASLAFASDPLAGDPTGDPLDSTQPPRTPGVHQITHTLEGTELRFTVHLPEGIGDRKKRKRPVVLALHYAGHGAPFYSTGYLEQLVVPGLSGLGAIVVAPDCPGAAWNDPAAEPLVLSLLDHAIQTWNGDPKRVLVTGYSMGGMGTWHYALTHPDRFAAAIPMAGHPGDDFEGLAIPVYAIHGRNDERIPGRPTELAILSLRAQGKQAFYNPVEGLTHFQVPDYAPSLASSLPWIRRVLQATGKP